MTVVNNPAPASGDNGIGFLIGAVVLVGFVAVLLFYGLPAIRNMGPVQLNVPALQVNVPDKLNVTVTQPE